MGEDEGRAGEEGRRGEGGRRGKRRAKCYAVYIHRERGEEWKRERKREGERGGRADSQELSSL